MTVRTIRGGGGTGPSTRDQAAAARATRLTAEAAKKTVEVRGKDGLKRVGTGPISFQGNAYEEPFYDAEERHVVVKGSDDLLYFQSGTAARRPADPGRLTIYRATDTGAHSSFDGTTWRTI